MACVSHETNEICTLYNVRELSALIDLYQRIFQVSNLHIVLVYIKLKYMLGDKVTLDTQTSTGSWNPIFALQSLAMSVGALVPLAHLKLCLLSSLRVDALVWTTLFK